MNSDFFQRFNHSLLPGLNLVIVVLPQAIAFSILAGVPPHFGVYCAMYGVLITSLLNPSTRFHGGPNSSMSVAMGVALLPYAPQFGNEYMGYALSLAVMVGAAQLLFVLIRPLSRLLDFMSEAVVSGIIFGIGLLGIFQTAAIMSQMRRITGKLVPTRRAVFADSIANLAAGFISALPGCGSFNRVTLLHAFEARSAMAPALSALFLGILIFLAKDLIAIIPLASMAALIMLVGANMLRLAGVRHLFQSPIEMVVFLSAFTSVHIFGLLNAAFTGAAFAFIDWVWHKAHPYVQIEDNRVSILGDLYYASLGYVEPKIAAIVQQYSENDG